MLKIQTPLPRLRELEYENFLWRKQCLLIISKNYPRSTFWDAIQICLDETKARFSSTRGCLEKIFLARKRQKIPLRFRKAGKVWFGGARETHCATCHNGMTPSEIEEFLKSPCFLDLNGSFKGVSQNVHQGYFLDMILNCRLLKFTRSNFICHLIIKHVL